MRAHPALEDPQLLGILLHVGQRHLVGAPEAFEPVAVHLLRRGPALGLRSTIIGQRGRVGDAALASLLLIRADLGDAVLHRRRHRLVHALGVGAFDEIRRPAVAVEQVLQFLVRDARQQRRVVDLVAVEVQDRQHRAVANRVEELVDVPGGRQRAGLGLAVADHGRHDQVGVVEGRAAGVREHVAEFAAFVDRARRFRRAVAADAAGERELLEELAQALFVLALVRVDLRVRAFQVDRAEHPGRAVPGPGQEDHVEVVLLDQPVQVDVDEARARGSIPSGRAGGS